MKTPTFPACDLRSVHRDARPMSLPEAVAFRALDVVLNPRGRYRDGCPVPTIPQLRSGERTA